MNAEKELATQQADDVVEVSASQDTPQADAELADRVEFSAAQKEVVERLIKERLERARRQMRKELEAEIRQALEKEAERAKMDELERLKLEIQERDQKLQQYEYHLADTAVRAEARIQALAMGVKPERVDYVVRLLNLSEIPVENGQADKDAVRQQLSELLERIPELRGSNAPSQVGGEIQPSQPSGTQPLTPEEIAKMSPSELRKRMPEILAYYAAKRKP